MRGPWNWGTSGTVSGVTRSRLMVFGLLAVLALALTFLFLPGEEEEVAIAPSAAVPASAAPSATVPASQAPKPRALEEPPAPVPEPERPVFVEVVYEVGVYPLKGKRVHLADRPDRLNGFVLEETPSGPLLHPAMGEAPAAPPRLWVGYRLVDLFQHDTGHFQWLGASRDSRLELATGELPSRPDLLARGGLFSLLRQPVELKLEREEDGEVRVSTGAETRPLVPGEWTELFAAEQTYTPDELFQAMVAAFEGIDGPQLDERALEDNIRTRFPRSDAQKLYLRLSVLLHGDVEVAATDVLSEWRRAVRLSVEGPYPAALEALEKVLLAVPGHRQAVERWAAVQDLVAKGAEASIIEGRLAFPPGTPDEALRALWRKYHPGVAAVADPKAPEDVALATAPVEDGRFRLAVPSGTYRLSVAVPGFEVVERLIEVKGRTEVDVPLAGR